MNAIQMQYKADTGNNAIAYADEILGISDIEDKEIYVPEYVQWLEEKVEELQKQQK